MNDSSEDPMISAQNRSLEPLLTMGSERDYAEKHLLLVGTGGMVEVSVLPNGVLS